MQVVEWIGAWPGAGLLRDSGTAYLFVNAAHILSIGLLLGSILPVDLRLLGFFRAVPAGIVVPFLLRFAAFGAVMAILTGLWLFSVNPQEYVTNTAFLIKMTLLALALGNIFLQHHSRDFRLALDSGNVAAPVRFRALLSAVTWLSVLLAGRWIGFL